MLFRRTIRSVLVALALTAGTVGLCASAPATDRVSPDLHIVPKSKSLEQKKSGGFTSVLKASALGLGKSLVKQVAYALTQKHPRQNQVARSFPFQAKKKLAKGSAYRSPAGMQPVRTALHAPMLEKLAEIKFILKKISQLPVCTYPRGVFHPEILSESNGEIFCAPHYKGAMTFSMQVSRLDASSVAEAAARGFANPAGCVAQQREDGKGNVYRQACSLGQGREAARDSSPLPYPARHAVGSAVTKEYELSIKHFTIDPVKAAELLAHGAMGARNALRGDRSRDNRAQSV